MPHQQKPDEYARTKAAQTTTAELRIHPPRTFEEIFAAELGVIDGRREAGQVPAPKVPLDAGNAFAYGLVGLALSGGGIRSAAINLGLLQAIGKRGVLHHVDYLSTVSGGGYVGSCLSSLCASEWADVRPGPAFPFWFDGKNENPVIKYLRQSRQYLGVEGGLLHLRTWRAISAYLGGLIVSLLSVAMMLAVFAGLYLGVYPWGVYGIERLLGVAPAVALADAQLVLAKPALYRLYLFLPSLALLALWAGSSLAYAAANLLPDLWTLKFRSGLARVQAGLLAGGVLFAVSGTLPFLLAGVNGAMVQLRPWLATAGLLSSLSLPAIMKLSQNLKAAETALRAAKRWLTAIGAAVLVVLICLGVLYGVWLYRSNAGFIALVALVALVALSFLTDINRISMFYFYRDRLSDAFVIKRDPAGPAPVTRTGEAAGPPPLGPVIRNDAVTMADLAFLDRPRRIPYHLVNACVNLPGSSHPALKDRRSDFFLVSPLYCGSPVLGYRDTRVYESNRVSLASALAVSGAAANPQFGTSSRPALAFLLSMLNARLGVWAENPCYTPRKGLFEFGHHSDWPLYLLRDLFSLANERDKLVNLSDGGHIDNLGLYELLRRRCKVVIASDASADPSMRFDDLGNALRKARIDLGVEVELDLGPIKAEQEHVVSGRIMYPVGPGEAPDVGVLLYVKSVVVPSDPLDIHQYRKVCPDFPHEPTTDQFFDEQQFESYRQLGYVAGKALCRAASAARVEGLGLPDARDAVPAVRSQRLTR